MVIINIEGKFNENTYLFDGKLMNIPGILSVYIIENEGMRMMIDTPSERYVRRFVKQLQEFGLYPIHKLLLTHSHWDHIAGATKLKSVINELEVFASENAIDNLKDPSKMNDIYGMVVSPIENVNSLKDGDIIDLNGLKLEVLNLFGHTMDSIGIFDKKNKNLFPGCTTENVLDLETVFPIFMPSDFHESETLKSFKRIRDMRNDLNSISLPHFGVWKDESMSKILNEMEDLYKKTKDSMIQWYNEDQSIESIISKFIETYTPNSKIFSKDNPLLEFLFGAALNGLKLSGLIEL